MTRDQWQRVKQVTAAALDLPADARPAFVVGACAGDEAFEREVVSLLESAALAEPLFEGALSLSPAVAEALDDVASPASIGVGARIGQYRIVREIGRGGMGRVFLAERADDEYQQHVALKIAHVRTPDVLRWFRDERQILATLDHPHIARLMDGGTTVDGVPYLVMEYIEGAPIDEYCTANGLGVAQRLTLFQQVCLAVAFANHRLVVHRDLKPRNILVANGVPKVLDFGIASQMPDDRTSGVDARGSNTGPGMLTPEYASPEQLRGAPVTMATDVYALGVLLYRLLTGSGPYRLESNAPQELAAAILEQDPVPPSATAGTRQLRRQLAGDLDAIVLTALKKDPAERYESAAMLADDVRRHLARLPIAARRDAVGYRVRRFVARHKLAVAAAALIVLSLTAGLAATARQARETELQRARAQRHFDDVRRLASSLIFEVHDGIENVPGTIQTRQLLVNRAVEYFDGLAAEERDNVDLQRELAEAYDRLGNVLGRPYSANLGETTAALASYRKALDIRERLAAAQPGDRRLQLGLWSSYYNVGGLLRETGDTRGALLLHEKARAVVEPLLVAAGDDEALLRSAAQTASTLSVTYAQAGRVRDGLASAHAALGFDQRLLARDPGNNALRQDLASVEGRIGMFLMKLGDLDGAEPHFRQGLDLAVALVAAEPSNVSFQRRLSNGHSHLAHLNGRRNQLDAAWEHQQAALAIRQQLVDQNPADRQASIDLMVSQIETGDVNVRRGELPAAMDRYRRAIDTAEALVSGDPRYVYYRLTLASGLTRLAQALIATGRPEQARSLVARATELTLAASSVDPADVRLRFELALAHAVTGDMAAATGNPAAAQHEYRTAVALMTALRDAGQLEGGTLNGDEPKKLAELERKLGVGAVSRAGS